jgi:hypothetical protein
MGLQTVASILILSLSFCFLLLLIFGSAYALEVQMSVSDISSLETRYFSFNDSLGLKKIDIETVNNGSMPYASQIRADIYNGSGSAFEGWSDSKIMMPGNNAFTRLYWIPKSEGRYTMNLSMYFGRNSASREYNISVDQVRQAQSGAFEIISAKTYRKFIALEIRSKIDSNATAMPKDFPPNWAVQQGQARLIANMTSALYIRYEPDVWSREQIKIAVASLDGKYVDEFEITLEQERGFFAMIQNMVFGLAP